MCDENDDKIPVFETQEEWDAYLERAGMPKEPSGLVTDEELEKIYAEELDAVDDGAPLTESQQAALANKTAKLAIGKEAEDKKWPSGKDGWDDYFNKKYGEKEFGKTVYKTCNHDPVKLIDGKNWSVWAADLWGARTHKYEFDIIVNCTGDSILTSGHAMPECLQRYVETRKDPEEIILDWSDMGKVNLAPEFWYGLYKYAQAKRAKVLVHCMGGHGRTGTATACLLIAACNKTAKEAVGWLREKYCKDAVETIGQEHYVVRVANGLTKAKRKQLDKIRFS